MHRAQYAILLAGAAALFSPTQTGGETLCRPTLTFEQARLAETRGRQRRWSAVVAVDASQCATASGRFYVNFVRIKEMTPDLLFSEEFTWSPGRMEISLDVWLDEALLDYWIGYVALCPCRP
jgi:hypothetical protein